MTEERLSFQTEVSRLLHLVANSLYSEKQIFLRELVSNAADACDRLRHLALTRPELIEGDPEFRIRIHADKGARTIEIDDNGIGMGRDELIADLGTIARSGSAAFLEQMTGEDKADLALIGQFGVGFYSAFMVAETVEVVSRKAGEEAAWRWVSDGSDAFTIAEAERPGRGTTVRLHLRAGEDEYLEPAALRRVIKTYSDHIGVRIELLEAGKWLAANEASALWTRPRSEITAQQYTEFYRHAGHMFDEPWLTMHWRAEGTIEYTALLFVPSSRPLDLFMPERENRLRLYVRRVFITDRCDELLPAWLRFIRGVVDSEDLPLNISREMLQSNPQARRIRSGLVRRILSELGAKANDAPEDYALFWSNFGGVLKEGLYEDNDHREALLGLARFHSTEAEGPVSLDDYVERMKEGQTAIYTISGESRAALDKSPQLEGFRARGVEVLLLTDPVDEFWVPAVGTYKDKPFRSATRAGAEIGDIPLKDGTAAEGAEAAPVDGLIAMFKLALGDAVKDVRASERLTDSAVCLVADEGDFDIRLERLLKQHGQIDNASKRILEINPRHALIAALAGAVKEKGGTAPVDEAAWLLLDQARILEGEPLPDPAAFSRRMTAMLERGVRA